MLALADYEVVTIRAVDSPGDIQRAIADLNDPSTNLSGAKRDDDGGSWEQSDG